MDAQERLLRILYEEQQERVLRARNQQEAVQQQASYKSVLGKIGNMKATQTHCIIVPHNLGMESKLGSKPEPKPKKESYLKKNWLVFALMGACIIALMCVGMWQLSVVVLVPLAFMDLVPEKDKRNDLKR